MIKIIFALFSFVFILNANNIYETNCLACHKDLPVSIDKYFYRYLLKYSSEKSVKQAMQDYLKNPTKETTIMPEAFIKRFGVKKPTKLSEKELEEALQVYWNKYKVFDKLQ